MSFSDSDDEAPPLLVPAGGGFAGVAETAPAAAVSADQVSEAGPREAATPDDEGTPSSAANSLDTSNSAPGGSVQAGPVPLTIVTGWLGSGKTSFMTHMLRHLRAAGRRVAIIQNEVSSLGVEKALTVEDPTGALSDLLELGNGCVCCTVQSDFVRGLEALLARQPFDHVFLECSGMADPGELAAMFWLDEELESRVYLDGVVCLVDLVNLERNLAGHRPEARQVVHQIAYGDHIVLNKTDLVDAAAIPALEAAVVRINSHGRRHHAVHGLVPDLEALLAMRAFDARLVASSVASASRALASSSSDSAGASDDEDDGDGPDQQQKRQKQSGRMAFPPQLLKDMQEWQQQQQQHDGGSSPSSPSCSPGSSSSSASPGCGHGHAHGDGIACDAQHAANHGRRRRQRDHSHIHDQTVKTLVLERPLVRLEGSDQAHQRSYQTVDLGRLSRWMDALLWDSTKVRRVADEDIVKDARDAKDAGDGAAADDAGNQQAEGPRVFLDRDLADLQEPVSAPHLEDEDENAGEHASGQADPSSSSASSASAIHEKKKRMVLFRVKALLCAEPASAQRFVEAAGLEVSDDEDADASDEDDVDDADENGAEDQHEDGKANDDAGVYARRTFYLQAVQHLFEIVPGDTWEVMGRPSAPGVQPQAPVTRFVFIGRNLDEERLAAGLDQCMTITAVPAQTKL